MTRLTFTGKRNGHAITITWEDGALSGDPETVAWIRYVAKLAEAAGTIVGPIGGPYSTSNHLADPYAARALILEVFPGKVRQEGLLPPRIAPPGAIL
jgi:hypothetical protein